MIIPMVIRENVIQSAARSRLPSWRNLASQAAVILQGAYKQALLQVAKTIRLIIEAVERGELDAPLGLVARLDGAGRALEVLAKRGSSSS
jgi:hypothetical protein